jgi:branched-chain amino acid transport system substrate-binding protein
LKSFTFLPPTTSDFSSTMATLQQQKADIVLTNFVGTTLGVFLKQYSTSGLAAPVFGYDFTADAQKVAPPSYNNYWFAGDFFDGTNPGNEWAKLFVKEFTRKYHVAPADISYYSANYYESTFMLWELMRRVIKQGKNPFKQGDAYVQALNSNPSFPSLYGRTGKHGTLSLNTKTHAVSKREMSVLQAQGTGKAKAVASFNIGGKGFKLL